MACKRLTIEEHQQLLLQNPNADGYATLDLCEGPCAGPAACSLDWRTAITINVDGSLETGIQAGGPGTVWFYWILSRYPSGRTKEWGSAALNCNMPPDYMEPSGGAFQFWNYSRCLSDTENGFPSCGTLYTFQVVLGPDGLPTRIKNAQSAWTGCTSGGDCSPRPFPAITFGRP